MFIKNLTKKRIQASILALLGCFSLNVASAKITLWGTAASPHVRKVQVILTEKHLSYEHQEILAASILTATKQAIPPAFAVVSPFGRIPALQDGETKLTESSVIAAYLEKRYPDSARLYPSDPALYARTLLLEYYGDHLLYNVSSYKIYEEAFIKPNVQEQLPNPGAILAALEAELPAMMDYLEGTIGNRHWLVGENFSIADIAVATHFVSLAEIGYKVDKKRWPNLHRYLKQVFARPSFKKVMKH